jgi:type I restriction enzyme R subunit
MATDTALAIQSILDKHWKVDFWSDEDAKNSVIDNIEDFFYDVLKEKFNVALSFEHIDEIIGKAMKIAKSRRRS